MASSRSTSTSTSTSTRSSGQRSTPATESSRAGFRPSKKVVALILILGLIVVAGALAIFTGGEDESTAAADGQSEEAHLEHVHGLGINPADGKLMIASHYGLFQLDDDGPVRVSEVQDFMGFTVMGEDHFLASGHPGQGQDAPANLGLIESTDGGATWDEVSLGGEADFHALDAAGDRVYGVDATSGQELMVSDDGGATWEIPGGPPLADVAVDRDDTDRLLSTSEQGPVVSDDAGQSFSPLSGAPLLQMLDSAEDGTVYGLDPAGGVHRSDDAGESWEQTWQHDGSEEDFPEAILAVDADEAWIALGGDVLHSEDGGKTFDVVFQG